MGASDLETEDLEAEEVRLLILRVTDDCNLRCRYCYARGGEGRDSMSLDVARRAIDYAAARSRALKIQFTGGEPLLELPLIGQVIEYAGGKKIPVAYQLQTNGTLITPAAARQLAAARIAVGISLDGLPEINDRLRPFADGRGSTTATLRGLENLRSVGMRVGLTVVLTADNCAGLPNLVELASYLGNVYGIALDLLRPAGRNASGGIRPPQPGLMAGQVRESLRRAELLARLGGGRVRFREVERLAYQLRQGIARRHYCYATTGQSLVVMPGGEVYPCSSLAGRPAFYLGSINDGDFSLTAALTRLPMVKRTIEDLAGCRDCSDRRLCGGGCLARAYDYTGLVDRPYEGDCFLKKVFIEWARGGQAGGAS